MSGMEELDTLKGTFDEEMHTLFDDTTVTGKELELRLHRRLDSFHAMATGSLRHRDADCRRARIIQVLSPLEHWVEELQGTRRSQNSASDDLNFDGECPKETPYLCDGFCSPYPC